MESAGSKSGKSSTATPQSTLKRNSDDIGWEFGFLYDPTNFDKVCCKLCNHRFSGGVYRVKEHISGRGSNVSACKKSTADDIARCAKALDDVKRKKKAKHDADNNMRAGVNIGGVEEGDETIDLDDSFGVLKEGRTFGPMDSFTTFKGKKECSKQSNLNNVVRKEQLIRVKEYICRWAYECAIPFHAFERDSFKLMMEAIGQFGPNAEPPTRYEMGETYLKKEVEKTKASLTTYQDEWKFLGCSIMTDAWSDRNRRSIMNLCVNSKLGTVFLSSKECSNEAHTSKHIFEYVDKCIEDVGPENVIQVVTDNASNNMGAAKLLKAKRKQIFWTSCATHTINLMLEGIGGISRYKNILDEAKKLTVFIYAHHKTLAMMRKFTLKRNIVRPGVTRFASAFLTLQSINQKKFELKQMFNSPDWDNCKFAKTVKGIAAVDTVNSASFWAGVTRCLNIFGPLVSVLRMVDADWKPSMGFIYGELQRAKKDIKSALNDKESLYKPIMDIISKKSSNRLDTCLHLTAYILNPYYFYNNAEVRDDVDANDAIVDFVSEVFPDQEDLHHTILDVELPMYKGKLGKFSRPIALKACEVNNDKFDPANWWETYGNSCPNLRKMAMRILSLTSSSSGCERNWSIKRKLRNRELLLADGGNAPEWIMDGLDEVQTGGTGQSSGVIDGVEEVSINQENIKASANTSQPRELDDEFESEDEEYVEVDYESDDVEIIEQCGGRDDELDDL
ncbi:hypothetical protein SSX86_008239 [Deinandra increscens subsp. villosa]|uniref:BED-type domain-containing protein n=1 Tax=Deinandra increscens subsp. villosa TaxID=3103831 RepID=A0AAP0DEW5_9ASTR